MKNISTLMWLALAVTTQAHAATLDWSEPLKVQTCLAEVGKHLNAQAKVEPVGRFEQKSAQVQALDEGSFACLVVGTWHERTVHGGRRETRAYYAAIQPLPVMKSRVGLVPAL
jgi:hypothetical protein